MALFKSKRRVLQILLILRRSFLFWIFLKRLHCIFLIGILASNECLLDVQMNKTNETQPFRSNRTKSDVGFRPSMNIMCANGTSKGPQSKASGTPTRRPLDAHDESKWKCRENLIDTVFSQIKSSTSLCREHLLQRAGIVDTGTDRKQYSLWEILTKDNRVRSYSYTFSNTERRVYSTVASQ